MKTKYSLPSYILAILSLALSFVSAPVYAANTAVTGGTNGPACNSGGYFTPSSVTITSGDTITFSVPVNDPYAGGVEVHGLPQGSFVVARGSSVTTSAISATVSYYGTWPSSGCMKGTGTITVNAPVVAPPPTPAPTPAPPPSTSPPSPTSSTSKSTARKSNTTIAVAPAQPTTPAATSTPTTAKPESSSKTTPTNAVSNTASISTSKNPPFKTVAIVSGSVLASVAVVAALVWRFLLRRRLQSSVPQASPTELPPTQYPGGTTKIGN